MALSEPFDILAEFPGWTTSFDLMWRQEQSRTAGGRTFVKDLGSPLWALAASTRTLKPNDLDHWRARLNAMENGLATFKGYAMSRRYPILYPNGSWPSGDAFDGLSASLDNVDANRKAVRVSGLPAGFVLSVGDHLSIDNVDLHQVMEAATADVSGVTPAFEVRPHIWAGVDASNSPQPVVAVKQPYCIMAIVPGSVSTSAGSNGFGSVSFRAIEAR